MAALDRCLRDWGRRALRWPSGTPNVAVWGTLGWWDAATRVRQRAASLIARLLALPRNSRSVVASVVAYAQTQPSSWLSSTLANLSACGVPLPSAWGIGPGVPRSAVANWCRNASSHTLGAHFLRRYAQDFAAIESLSVFQACVPRPLLDRRIHNTRISAGAAREWTLARCGHHPFTDGRPSRHVAQAHGICACGNAADVFMHAVRSCPVHAHARAEWLQRIGLAAELSNFSDEELLRMLFDTASAPATAWIRAHVAFVASLCVSRRSLDQ